ncbi:MAG TPA: type II toxin-antitoxin system VapC family toxin [Ideonella sp.]|uniref:type II toxin-antitoxin system VapC family toxin n=1 Tax=Ideonella sp. TaxID=1929293 RepID=UPI002B8E47E2|nr:type II toxin-antitoxin system VapC family toxin [Ideonella sp.]HSI51687.1 type II toxin-antitoxin system VapC family toxin [Ideonella sp.]
MVYVDTSVLVPLFLNEPHGAAAAAWYSGEKAELVAAAWCIPEFASALGIKQRTGAINAQQAKDAWARFERMVAADLQLLPVEPVHFHRAAELVLDATSALRAGDALHLACAEAAGAKHIATLDEVLARNAQRLKIKPVVRRSAT